jgi:hypothetical protein
MRADYLIYIIQHKIGIQPKWERDLIQKDKHLQTFLSWMEKRKPFCKHSHSLYHNRLNFLKGWLR